MSLHSFLYTYIHVYIPFSLCTSVAEASDGFDMIYEVFAIVYEEPLHRAQGLPLRLRQRRLTAFLPRAGVLDNHQVRS